MANVGDIVVVNISREGPLVTQKGFGVPLVFGVHTRFAEKYRVYASLEEVASDFQTSDIEYLKAVALFSQEVKPEKIMIGKRVANAKQKNHFVINTVANNTDYRVTINGIDYTFTSSGSATATNITTGILAAIAAGSAPVVATNNTTNFDLESTIAGLGFSVSTSSNLTVTVLQVNVSVVTELIALQEIDGGDDWYILILTSQTEFDILQTAAYIETQAKLYFALTTDSDVVQSVAHIQTLTFDADLITGNSITLSVGNDDVGPIAFATSHAATLLALATAIEALDTVLTATITGARQITVTGQTPGQLIDITDVSVTGGVSQAVGTVVTTQDPDDNVGSQLKLLNYDRTNITWTELATNHIEAAWVGLNISEDPGSITWKFKNLSGVIPDELTSTEKNSLELKNMNYYREVGGKAIMQEGICSSSEYIDIMQGIDFLTARIQEKVYQSLINEKKIPFTAAGIDVVVSDVRSILQLGTEMNIIAVDPPFTVTPPDIKSIPKADKGARLLRTVKFVATLAGAIHKVQIAGTLTV